MKYISMKIDPKGRIPEIGMMKNGEAYQGAAGIGLRRDRGCRQEKVKRGESEGERGDGEGEGQTVQCCSLGMGHLLG